MLSWVGLENGPTVAEGVIVAVVSACEVADTPGVMVGVEDGVAE